MSQALLLLKHVQSENRSSLPRVVAPTLWDAPYPDARWPNKDLVGPDFEGEGGAILSQRGPKYHPHIGSYPDVR